MDDLPHHKTFIAETRETLEALSAGEIIGVGSRARRPLPRLDAIFRFVHTVKEAAASTAAAADSSSHAAERRRMAVREGKRVPDTALVDAVPRSGRRSDRRPLGRSTAGWRSTRG